MYKPRRYSTSFAKKSADSAVKRVVYKLYKSVPTVSVANLSSVQLNPVHDFVTNDTRYADFIKTCNEWRVASVSYKITPNNVLSANLALGVNLVVAHCMDKAAPYRASA